MTIQEEVLKYIEEHGMKKNFFAKKIEVSPMMFSHWLQGRVQFNKNRIDKIYSIIR